MKDAHKQLNLKQIGPGGYKCPCCNDYFKKSKAGLTRLTRHRLKQADQKDFKRDLNNDN